MRKLFAFVYAISIALTVVPSVEAKVWYVGNWTGKPTAEVKTTLSEAYTVAASGDQIWVSEGTYTTATITMKDGVSVYGGFAGTESALNERTKPTNGQAWEFDHPTILKNSGTGEACHIFNSSSAMTLTFDGLTLEGTSSHGRAINVAAGGNSGKYTIQNCIIRNFTSGSGANNDGGGLNLRANAEVAYCLITNNYSPQKGGGGYFDYVNIHHCRMIGNSTITTGTQPLGSANGCGGGAFITANSTIYNCWIEGNTATFAGGVYARGRVYNCIIVNNIASKSGSGVAYDERDSGGSVYNNTIANNRSTAVNGAGVCFTADNSDRIQTLCNNILYKNTDNTNTIVNVGVNLSGAGKATPTCKNNIIDRMDYNAAIELSSSIASADSTAIFGTDYLTLTTSPGIDKGYTKGGLSFPATDYAGGERIVGNSIDIGPYEKQLTPPVVSTLKVTEDTQVRGGTTADQSFPMEKSMLVQKGSANAQGEAFLRFPLTGLANVAATDTVGKVEITLYLAYAGKACNDIALQVFPVTSTWNSTTLTWNNKGNLAYGNTAVAQSQGGIADPTNTAKRVNEPLTFDITKYALEAHAQKLNEISLVIRCNNAVSYGYVQFYTMDDDNATQHPTIRSYVYKKSDWIKETLYDVDDPSEAMFNLLLNRIRTDNESKKNPAALSASVTSHLTKYATNGSFSDVNYASTERTDWVPLDHVDRLSDFVFAYTLPGSNYYENDDLYQKIVNALQYWYDRNPYCSNWWYNQIAEPQRLGILMIQMRKGKQKLPLDLVNLTIDRMRADGGNPASQTGANKTDVALHWLYRACLTADASLLSTTLAQGYDGLKYVSTTAEGLQVDGSNFQHSTQLYIGGYGDEFIKGVTMFAMYTAGTQYALSGDKLAILSRFVRETWLKAIRGQYMMWSVSGRGILSRKGESLKQGAATYIDRMLSIDPDHADEYRAAIKRMRAQEPADYQAPNRNTHYYIGDYTLHNRKDYTFDVRLVSTRTKHIEYGNGENLKTFFASDGCTNIAVNGNEYKEIFPVWNWTRIPGITCPQVSRIPLSKSDWQQPGTSTFAGAVSDSLYAATGYSYTGAYTGNSAKKGYFFFDDEIVCLGSDITSTIPSNDYVTSGTASFITSASQFDINTTVNQCLLDGNITVSSNGIKSNITEKGDHPYPTAPDWVLHDSVGYVFPSGGNISISNKTQTGNWYDINTTGENKSVSADVFTLWMNHGKAANKAQYAYIVVPNKKTTAEMDTYTASQNIEIMANTDSVQVVYHKGLGIRSMIFYKAATFEGNDMAVKVNRACALLFKDKGDCFTMHVADPAQSQAAIKVSTRIPAKATEWTDTNCNFTGTGANAGASKVYTIIPTPVSGQAIAPVNDPVINTSYYNLTGQPVQPAHTSIYIVKKTHLSNRVTTTKEFIIK